MKSIYWIVESSGLSGGVRVALEYATRLAALGYGTTILSLEKKPDWFSLGARIKWLNFPSYEAIIIAAREAKPDILFATWWKTAFVVKDILDGSPGSRGLYLVQDIETAYYFEPLYIETVRESYELGLEHVTTSRWVQSQLPGCEYIGLAIGKWRDERQRSRQRYALACVRPQALKGYRELGEVYRYLASRGISLMTFGLYQGAPFGRLHIQAGKPVQDAYGARRKLSDQDLQRLYGECGVFISTSRHEGLSMTPLEAMAVGAPVVMFDADGNMEYAQDGGNCLIATDPLDMYGKIVEVLDDRALAARLSKSGQETARRYASWLGPVERLRQVIEKAALDSPLPVAISSEVG